MGRFLTGECGFDTIFLERFQEKWFQNDFGGEGGRGDERVSPDFCVRASPGFCAFSEEKRCDRNLIQ